ncbi:MAG: hypothetical protein ACYCX7_11355 [Solirubrobacteraceae bacterium]
MPSTDIPKSQAIEDYCKAIFALESRSDGSAVSTTALAERLAITPGSVSAMLRKLVGISFALIPLVLLTSNREVMGVHVNSRATTLLAVAIAVAIVAFNVLLIDQQIL